MSMSPLQQVPSQDAHLAVQQDLYTFNVNKGAWISTPLSPSPTRLSTLYFLTWNVDFAGPHVDQRLARALEYIQELTGKTERPTLIQLQEVESEAIPILLESDYIRHGYAITDTSDLHWPFGSAYGTVTLVPTVLVPSVQSIFRVRFVGSVMGRDALNVDLQHESGTYRFTNVHLESLRGRSDAQRVEQLGLVARLLTAVHGGVVGGDMNAIAPSDADLPAQKGLNDAWLTVHAHTRHVVEDRLEDEGVENNKENETDCTWGYQPPETVYPPGRLDKVLTKGSITVDAIERVGVDVRLETKRDVWVSDHYGLLAQIRLE